MEISDLDRDDLDAYDEQIVEIRESLYQTLDDKLSFPQEQNKRIFAMMALVNALAVLMTMYTMGNKDAYEELLDQFCRSLRKGCKRRGEPTLH